MRHILTFIFLSLLFLTGAKNLDETFHFDERKGEDIVLQKDAPSEHILSFVSELPDRSEAYVDSESLTNLIRICGRGYRSLSVQHVLLNKSTLYRSTQKRLELLCHSTYRIYTSLPRQSWTVPSLHYVFELRHILI